MTNKTKSIIAVLVLTTILSIAFGKTVFFAAPISKLFVLSQEDSLYHPDLKDWQIRAKFDPCVYFFQQPTSFQIDRTWQQGIIPFWNPNSSAGQPILAHIEAGVFSGPRAIFPVSSEYLYNLGIVCKLIVASIGVFILARLLSVSPLYSLVAALLFAFCPYIIRELELDKETWTYSWILSSFIFFCRRKTLVNASLLGGICGYVCATIHPECSFNTIVLSSLFVLLQACFDKSCTKRIIFEKVTNQLGFLVGVGAIAFATCAPVFLPFIEYMHNSDCYKFENIMPPIVPFEAFILGLISPILGGNSAFLGALALPLLLYGAIILNRKSLPLFLSIVISTAVMTAFGPLKSLFAIAPFNRLEPIYVQPWCFMLLSVAIAMAVESFRVKLSIRKLVFFIVLVCLVAYAPFEMATRPNMFTGLVWDAGMEPFAVSLNAAKRDLVLAILCCIFVMPLGLKKFPWFNALVGRFGRVASLILVGSLLFSEMSVARNALPVHESFNYPAPPAIQELQKYGHGARMLATGRHFMWPNTACVWNLQDFRAFNSLYPPGFLEFQRLCGARKYFASHFRYEDALTRFTDLASVKYIVSRSPVWSDDVVRFLALQKLSAAALLESGVKMESSKIYLDESNASAFANCRITAPKYFIDNYCFQFVLMNSSEKEIWSSDIFPLHFYKDQDGASLVAHWSLPQNFLDCRFGVRFCNAFNYAPVFPLSTKHGQSRNVIYLTDNNKPILDSSLNCNSRFHIRKMYDDGIRIYQADKVLTAA